MKLELTKPEPPKPITQEQIMEVLDKAYEAAVNGLPGQKNCRLVAKEYLDRYGDVSIAVKKFRANQAAVCATSGFITNLGGLLTLPFAIPANLASVIYVQLRMIAVIASMGGYNVNDDAVQAMVYICLVGMSVADAFKEAGVAIGNKLAVNAIKKIPGEVVARINEKLGFRFLTKFGEKGIVNLGKVVPVVGGVIGGGVDWAGTRIIARRAYKTFVLENTR